MKTVYIHLISVNGDITCRIALAFLYLNLYCWSRITDSIAPLIVWAWTEQWLVLILGSLPPLRALFALFIRRISTYKSRSRNQNSGYCLQSDLPIHVPASRQTPKDTDSESNILPGEAGIIHTTEIEIFSNPRCSGDISNEHLNVGQREMTFWTAERRDLSLQ